MTAIISNNFDFVDPMGISEESPRVRSLTHSHANPAHTHRLYWASCKVQRIVYLAKSNIYLKLGN